mmetsp:Transcript_39748/g.100140  ORF Transcript_39748/g.100140 Transcript_39748/m.100140 type:complete len:539 (+) Transcript_39748:814-2430(+)
MWGHDRAHLLGHLTHRPEQRLLREELLPAAHPITELLHHLLHNGGHRALHGLFRHLCVLVSGYDAAQRLDDLLLAFDHGALVLDHLVMIAQQLGELGHPGAPHRCHALRFAIPWIQQVRQQIARCVQAPEQHTADTEGVRKVSFEVGAVVQQRRQARNQQRERGLAVMIHHGREHKCHPLRESGFVAAGAKSRRQHIKVDAVQRQPAHGSAHVLVAGHLELHVAFVHTPDVPFSAQQHRHQWRPSEHPAQAGSGGAFAEAVQTVLVWAVAVAGASEHGAPLFALQRALDRRCHRGAVVSGREHRRAPVERSAREVHAHSQQRTDGRLERVRVDVFGHAGPFSRLVALALGHEHGEAVIVHAQVREAEGVGVLGAVEKVPREHHERPRRQVALLEQPPTQPAVLSGVERLLARFRLQLTTLARQRSVARLPFQQLLQGLIEAGRQVGQTGLCAQQLERLAVVGESAAAHFLEWARAGRLLQCPCGAQSEVVLEILRRYGPHVEVTIVREPVRKLLLGRVGFHVIEQNSGAARVRVLRAL